MALCWQALPKEATERLEDPDSLWNVGWSHGREALDDGRPDVHKASFYANPLVDLPDADAVATERFPSYCRCELGPRQFLPAAKGGSRLESDSGVTLV